MATVDWDAVLDAELESTPPQPTPVAADRQADSVDWDAVLDAERRARLDKVAETLSRTPDIGLGELAVASQTDPEDRQLLLEIAQRQYKEDQTSKKAGYAARTATGFVKAGLAPGMASAKLVGAIPRLDPEQERFKQQLEAVRRGEDPLIREDTNFLGRTFQQVVDSVPYMARAVGAFTTGRGVAKTLGAGAKAAKRAGVVAGTAAGTAPIATGQYEELIAEGIEPRLAAKVAIIGGVAESALEFILPNPFEKWLPFGKGKIWSILKSVGIEILEEGAQGAEHEVANQVARALDKEVPFEGVGNAFLEAVKQGGESMVEAGPVVGMMVGGPGAVSLGAGAGLDAYNRRIAKQDAAQGDTLRQFDRPPSGKEWKEAGLPSVRRKGRPRLPNAEQRAEAWQQAQQVAEIEVPKRKEEARGPADAAGTDAPAESGVGLDRRVSPPEGSGAVPTGPPDAPPAEAGVPPDQDAGAVPAADEPKPKRRPGVKPSKPGTLSPVWDGNLDAWVSKTHPSMIYDAKANGWRLRMAEEGFVPAAPETPSGTPRALETLGEVPGEQETGAEVAPQAPVAEPRPGEGESEYLERMLGVPGSEQRRIGEPAAVERYRSLWQASQRQQPVPEAPTPEAAPAEPVTPAPPDYSTLKKPDLLAEIRKRGLKHYSGKKKAELQAMLESDDQREAEPAAGEADFGTKPYEVSRIATVLPETGAGRAVGSFFRRFFTAAGELPAQAYDAKIRKQGQVAKEMAKLKFVATDFRRGTREALGGQELMETDAEKMNAVLRGEAAPNTVPEEVRAPLLAMRDHIDSLSRQLIAEGVAQGDLIGVITKNLGVYATRSYRVFDNPNWRKQVPPEIRNRAVAAVEEMYPEKTDAERAGILESLLFKGAAESPAALLRGSKLGSKDLGIFMRRKDIPEWLRDLWGEYKDAGVNYARSVFKMSHLRANHQFLNEVRKAGLGTWLRTEEEGPAVNEYGEVITKIAADSSSVMAPLNGLYTTPEIKAAFEQIDAPAAMPSWLRLLMTVNYAVKYGKTVGSAMTHVRNLISNVGFAVANGHWRLDKAGKAIWATATGIGNLSSPEFRTYYQRLAELGLVGEDVRAGELRDALRDASKADIDEYLYNTQERHARKIVNTGRAAYRATNALYQAEDGVWKVYAWENEKARYAKAYPEWTANQVEEHAAQIVRNTYPTYSKVGAGVKAIRQFPLVGTFVNFPAEVIRTTFHSLRIAKEEMAAPETRAIGAQRLAGTTVALGGLSVLSYGTMAALGISGDEDDDLRWFVPPWQENSRFLYLMKKPGKYRYVDLGYSDPHAWLTDAVVAYMRGEGFIDGVASATAEVARPFTSEEILWKAMRTAASNQTETGGQVYNPKDDLNQQALAVMGYLWDEALEPGTISHSRRIYAGFAGTDPRLHGPTEVVAMTTGQRIQTVDVQHSLGFRIRDFSANLGHIQKIGRKTVTSRGTVTGEQVAADRARMEKLRLAEFSEMQRMLGAARRLGVPPRTIRTMLRDELNNEVAEELLSGDYSSYQLTPQTVQAMLAASPEEFQDRFAAWHGDDLSQATRDVATPLIANFPIAKPKQSKYKTDDEYQDAVGQWQQGRDKAKQTLSSLDVPLDVARELLKTYWLDRYGSIRIKGTRRLRPAYTDRRNALKNLYSKD